MAAGEILDDTAEDLLERDARFVDWVCRARSAADEIKRGASTQRTTMKEPANSQAMETATQAVRPDGPKTCFEKTLRSGMSVAQTRRATATTHSGNGMRKRRMTRSEHEQMVANRNALLSCTRQVSGHNRRPSASLYLCLVQLGVFEDVRRV
jgi:hypothetical protein